MNRLFLSLCLGVVLAAGAMVPASAGTGDWTSSDISEVVEKVRGMYDQAFDSEGFARLPRVDNLLGPIHSRVVTTYQSYLNGREDVLSGTHVRTLLEAMRTELAGMAQNEAGLYAEFVKGPEPAELRERLVELLRCLEDLANLQLRLLLTIDVPCVPQVQEDLVKFQKLVDLVNEAPDGALYPLHRAKDVLDPVMGLLGSLLDCAKTNARAIEISITELFMETTPPDALVADVERMTALRNVSRTLKTAAKLSELTGGLLIAASDFVDLSTEAALWGWIGFSADSDPAKSLGRIMVDSVPPPMTSVAARIDRLVAAAETSSFRSAVIENQRTIIDLLTKKKGRGKKR